MKFGYNCPVVLEKTFANGGQMDSGWTTAYTYTISSPMSLKAAVAAIHESQTDMSCLLRL